MGMPLQLCDLGTASARETLRLFAGSLYTPLFEVSSRPIAGQLRIALNQLGDTETFLGWRFPGPLGDVSPTSSLANYRDKAALLVFPSEKLSYWAGWKVTNLAGQRVRFRLHSMHDRFGHAFTARFFEACKSYFGARRFSSPPTLTRLDAYIGIYPSAISPEDFQSRAWISTFLRDFMGHNFVALHKTGASVRYATESWKDFSDFLQSAVLGHIWAKPYQALPRPTTGIPRWKNTHVRTKEDGTSVKTKLLTQVPLHISDSEAVDLIWRKIGTDVDQVTLWASLQASQVWKAYQERQALAPAGTASKVGMTGVNSGLRFRNSRQCPQYRQNAAATYEHFGHLTRGDFKGDFGAIYPSRLSAVARELGIPSEADCFAYASLIVRDHPQFTPSALEGLEVFDENGRQAGFMPRDGGWTLTAYKLRKGAALAEIKVYLSETLATHIAQLIQITAPLRNYLRARNDPTWRRLFLYAETVGARPRVASFAKSAPCRKTFIAALKVLAGVPAEQAERLASQFTLARLRASCGVLVYFQTRSVQAMAEALGHTHYSSSLLSRYLPPILQEFFVERWIRLFQQGIICHAMSDSPHLLEASGFSTAEQLDEFLASSANFNTLKSAPPPVTEDRLEGKVFFGVTPELLATLGALESHVSSSGRPVRSNAARWAELGTLIAANVGADPDLSWMIGAAANLPRPTFAEDALYG